MNPCGVRWATLLESRHRISSDSKNTARLGFKTNSPLEQTSYCGIMSPVKPAPRFAGFFSRGPLMRLRSAISSAAFHVEQVSGVFVSEAVAGFCFWRVNRRMLNETETRDVATAQAVCARYQ